jgi:hypothetical protein
VRVFEVMHKAFMFALYCFIVKMWMVVWFGPFRRATGAGYAVSGHTGWFALPIEANRAARIS